TGTAETIPGDTDPCDSNAGSGDTFSGDTISEDGVGHAGAGSVSGDATGQGPDSSSGSSLEPPVRVLEGHLVIDLATLRREADNLCLLDGTPISAPVGRELARSVRAWRRIVTDPVTGHLLDYGRRVYLPPPLLRFIHARDGLCTAPYCQRPASRCQNDHRTPFPEGPSNTTNCALLCDRHHPLKTDRYVSITNGHANGSMTWTTAWGQQVTTEPRPYLDTPNPPGPAAADHDDTGPPGEPDATDDDSEGPLPF
ncbi:MAG TPA: HNH endonuclease signature motif containing protein, partial [Candidatus Nanopelagicales bacterium]